MKVNKWDSYTLEFPDITIKSFREGASPLVVPLRATIENGRLQELNSEVHPRTAEECREFASVFKEIADYLEVDAEVNEPGSPPF